MDAQENRIFTAILITVFVLGSIITYFIVSILRHHRKNVELHKQNILAEITQIEKERERIAHDLHDELGPLLSAVKMKINSFDLSDKEDKIQVEKTNAHLNEVLKRIREISFNLMPNSLLRKGIIPALKEFVEYLNNNTKIRFLFTFEKEIKLSEQNDVNMYRVIQEVVHNTIKHSHANELRIDLKKVKNNVVLSMADNGVGFDYTKESEENIGFGLRSLLIRTEIMNGKMFIDSEPGKGTTYTFEIPL
jgi:two-component system NarL family sensor kinase